MKREVPAWYRKRRTTAKKLYEKKKPAKYGSDLDLNLFTIEVPARSKIDDLYDLSFEERTASRSVGTRDDEEDRSGTYFQYDQNVIYLHYTELLKKHFQTD